jgi:ricin-type beta-trefoil lectin protein
MKPFSNRHPAVRPLTRGRAALLAAAVTAAVMLAPASAADVADTYRVEITNLRSGLKVDVMWASQQRYQGVFLWPNNTSASQEFDLLDSGNGYFRIRARHSGQCLMLDWRAGPYTNGTRVVQSGPACKAGYRPAEWRRGWVSSAPICDGDTCQSTGTQYPVLINRRTGRCLDAANPAGGKPRAQAILQQWTCIRSADDWNAGNQLWRFGNEKYW